MVEEEEEVGIPEWVVTFGDMMSLLLTFFIMLVSLSEIKEEEKYQEAAFNPSDYFHVFLLAMQMKKFQSTRIKKEKL